MVRIGPFLDRQVCGYIWQRAIDNVHNHIPHKTDAHFLYIRTGGLNGSKNGRSELYIMKKFIHFHHKDGTSMANL